MRKKIKARQWIFRRKWYFHTIMFLRQGQVPDKGRRAGGCHFSQSVLFSTLCHLHLNKKSHEPLRGLRAGSWQLKLELVISTQRRGAGSGHPNVSSVFFFTSDANVI